MQTAKEWLLTHDYTQFSDGTWSAEGYEACPEGVLQEYMDEKNKRTSSRAIAVGPDREATADLIVKAPRMEQALRNLLDYLHPTIDREIIARIKEVL